MVSVIVALFNKAPYVRRSIDAILRQSYRDFEIIVVDDGSTDGSREIVEALAVPRLRVIAQKNAGPGAARNTGIAAATGDVLAFLDADDEWEPTYLERNVALLARYPEAVCVSSACVRVPPNRSMVPAWQRLGVRDGLYRWEPDIAPRFMMHLVAFTGWTSATVMRATAVSKTGGFFERGSRFGEDTFLLLKLMLTGPFVINVEALATYHVAASDLNRGARGARRAEAFLQDPSELYALCPEHLRAALDDVLAAFAARTACVLTYWGEWREARALMRRFPARMPWRLPYYGAAAVAANPLGAAGARLWRAFRSILAKRTPSAPPRTPGDARPLSEIG